MDGDFFYNAIGYTFNPEGFYNVAGDPDGDEDNFDYENSDAPPGGEVGLDMPKYRQLIRAKKLDFKNRYGKGHYGGKKDPNKFGFTWYPGWRRKWKEFKQSGGLAAIKLACKTGDTTAMNNRGITVSNVNPNTGLTESHTPAEWNTIFAQYNAKQRGLASGNTSSSSGNIATGLSSGMISIGSSSDNISDSNDKSGKILGMKPVFVYIIGGILVLGVVAWIIFGKKIAK